MDAWETLVSTSSLTDGDAWGHLNAQSAGSGDIIIVTGAIEVDVINETQDINLIDDTSAQVDFDTSAEIISQTTSSETSAVLLTADAITEVR